MLGLSRQQQLIVAGMAAATVIVCSALGVVMYLSLTSSPQPAGQPGSLPPDDATGTAALATPLFPTWTPIPTSTPFVPPTATPRPWSEDDAPVLDQVETDVMALRLLLPESRVDRWSSSRRQVRSRYDGLFGSETWQEELASLSIILSALDLIAPDTDLPLILGDVYAEQVYGYYDPAAGGIYIRHDLDASSLLGRTTYAHTYAHALQDQRHDLAGLGFQLTESFGYDDRRAAVNALVEGDVALLEAQYIDVYFSEFDQGRLEQERARRSDAELAAAPRVLVEMIQFPYTSGRDFAQALFETGGWAAVDAAYANPPVSTEQILHPERYRAGDQPVSILIPSLSNVLGAGWQMVYDGTMGEFLLGFYLQTRIDAQTAAGAVEGWGGDRCAVYRNAETGASVVLLHVAWDTPAEAAEFQSAYVSYAGVRFGHTADDITGGASCWEGGDVLCVARSESAVVAVLGSDRATVDKVMAVSVP